MVSEREDLGQGNPQSMIYKEMFSGKHKSRGERSWEVAWKEEKTLKHS